MTKKTYKIIGMHCTSCPLLIEGELEDIGVKCSCNYAKARLDVEYDGSGLTEEKIRQTVKSAGYDLVVQ